MAIEKFHFTDAIRGDMQLLVGLSGPTGAGKSNTALLLALGIQAAAGPAAGPIALIDTENGRSGIYAPKPGAVAAPPNTFNFKRLDLSPPFIPTRFKSAVEASKDLNPSCLIIDQLTAEWTGDGGILDYVGEEQARPGVNKFAVWNKPKRAHTAMMAVLDQYPAHVIICLRAKEKLEQVGQTIVNAGWRAIAETELPYQFTFHFLVGHKSPGSLTYDRTVFDQAKFYADAEGVVADGEQGTAEVGRRLALWAAGAPQGEPQ